MSFLDAKSYDTLFGLPELYEDALPRFSLSCEDIACARTHRRSHNRLGFAIQLALVRDLGRTLRAGEIPPEAVITVVAEQLDIDPAVFTLYAQREETRREHAREIVSALALRSVRSSDYRMLIIAATREAATTEKGLPITRAVINKLKDQRPEVTCSCSGTTNPSGNGGPGGCPTPFLSGTHQESETFIH